MNESDLQDLRQVNEMIAKMEAVVNPRPSLLANIRSFKKIRRRILDPHDQEDENVEYQEGDLEKFCGIDPDFTGDKTTEDYVDSIRG